MGEIPESEVVKVMPDPSSSIRLRIFYLRVSKCEVNESMVDSLTITHIPLSPDTAVKVNGEQPSTNNGHVSCSLHRDRVDKTSQEATFVSTDTVTVTGNVRFEVQNNGEKLLVGILEMCDVDGFSGEEKNVRGKCWVMKCQVAMQRGSGFLKSGETKTPMIEVYVASLFQGAPIVCTKAMPLRFRRKRQAKVFMEPIPECGEQVEDTKDRLLKHDPQEPEYRCYKPELDVDDDSFYMGSAGLEGEDSELSWFTAGVSLGVGIGAGLLARSYQSTSRNLKRRLLSNLF